MILAAALVSVNACAPAYRAAPPSQERRWTAYLGSSRRANAAADTLAADPAPVWRTDVGRGVVGAPALTEGLVLLSQVDRHLAVLDRRTGAVVWRHGFGENIGSGPLVDYDRVYVATETEEGRVAALDLATGNRQWSTRVGDVAAPIAMRDARIYAGTTDGLLVALSADGGSVLWRVRLPGGVRAAPVAVAEGVIVATASDSLFLVNGTTGEIRARRGTSGAVLAAPALADSLLVVGTTSGRLEGCDAATLRTLWSRDLGSGVVGAVAVQRDTAFVLTHDGDLWRVPLRLPEGATKLALGVVARAAPVPVAGGVLVADVTGQLSLVGAGGARLWTAKLHPPLSEPAVVDGRFFVAASERGEVVAYQ